MLCDSSHEIRRLTFLFDGENGLILCSLKQASSAQRPTVEYEALSYPWGPVDPLTRSLKLGFGFSDDNKFDLILGANYIATGNFTDINQV